jgi:two-component system cell cycle response regulator
VSTPNNSILDEIKASGRLPSPTGVALTLLELTRDPNTRIDEMAVVLQGDPSLSGQIIKYANSAASGNRKPVASINGALVRLGMCMVRQLCLGFSILSNSEKEQTRGFDYGEFWARSLSMASSCQTLARSMGTINPDEGFTCGLLAEIGGLALASVYPEKYAEVMDKWDNGPRGLLIEIEEEILSINRNQVTACLFESWGLPKFYLKAVLHKDETEWTDLRDGSKASQDWDKLAHLLFAGGLAAEICMETGQERHWRVLDLMNFGKVFKIEDDEMVAIYDEIMEEWKRMGKVLDVLTGQVPSMATMLRTARSKGGDAGSSGVIDDNDSACPIDSQETVAPADIYFDEDAEIGLRILVATDCQINKKIMVKKLTAGGHTVTCAKDGREALTMAVESEAQLIISDWAMPEMDGLELCRTLRSSPQLSHIHFIIMTSHESNNQLVEAFDAGINYYLAKPLNHRILTALLGGAAREVANREEVQRQKDELRRTNAEVSISNRALKTMALEDQLTGLPNRRAGLEALDKAWSKAQRDNEALLVMIMDIDHFKAVNDTYGHEAGDEVLKHTADAMKNAVRDYDEICRFGGEEFLVVCPGAGVEVAAQVGNRIRLAVEKNHVTTAEFDGGVTISIGAAIMEEGIESPKDLVKLADEALYGAKEAGRNKVCIYAKQPA